MRTIGWLFCVANLAFGLLLVSEGNPTGMVNLFVSGMLFKQLIG